MNWIKQIIITTLFLTLSIKSNAQARTNTWFRGTAQIPIGTKLTLDSEIQHRRQENEKRSNALDENLLYSFRQWVHYQPHKTLRLSVSPFAYFSNNRIILKQGDELANPNREIRFAGAIEFQQPITPKIFILNRSGVEYRMFLEPANQVVRVRNRLGLRYEVTSKTKIFISDEILVNAKGVDTKNFYDHNRLGINITHQLTPRIGLDLGYLRINRLPMNNSTKINENNLVLNLTYKLGKN